MARGILLRRGRYGGSAGGGDAVNASLIKAGLRPTRRGMVQEWPGWRQRDQGFGIACVAGAAVEARRRSGGSRGWRCYRAVLGRAPGRDCDPGAGHSYFAALDLHTANRDDLVKLLRSWTAAAAHMAAGQPAAPIGLDLTAPAPDTGEALGLRAARLTVTFGFGTSMFVKDGKDRYGLGAQRPPALVELPRSTATSWLRRAPEATCRSRPAPRTRRSFFTRCANWRGWPMARRKCAGRRPAI